MKESKLEATSDEPRHAAVSVVDGRLIDFLLLHFILTHTGDKNAFHLLCVCLYYII